MHSRVVTITYSSPGASSVAADVDVGVQVYVGADAAVGEDQTRGLLHCDRHGDMEKLVCVADVQVKVTRLKPDVHKN